MGQPTIRGHQGQFKFFQDNALLNIVDLTSVEVTQDSTFISSTFVGRQLPEQDQSIEGWSGSADAEVRGPEVDDLIDALITNNLNGIGVSDYTFLTTEQYADGTTRSYVYFDVVWKMSTRQSGLTEKITKRLEFKASGRQKL